MIRDWVYVFVDLNLNAEIELLTHKIKKKTTCENQPFYIRSHLKSFMSMIFFFPSLSSKELID